MIKILTTTLLGVVEGVTEFLPISSTGHLILLNKLLHLANNQNQEVFDVFIQSGAITAVIILYSQRLFKNVQLWSKLLVGFIPAAIIGFLLRHQVARLLSSPQVVLVSLFIGGVFFLVWDRVTNKFKVTAKEFADVTYKQAFIIGVAQCLAIIPGVSRSAATIFGGLLVGLEKRIAVEFSFLLAIPTLFAASGLVIWQSRQELGSSDWFYLGLGFVVTLLSAWLTIRFFLEYLKKHSFTAFGWYRIVLASLYALLVR